MMVTRENDESLFEEQAPSSEPSKPRRVSLGARLERIVSRWMPFVSLALFGVALWVLHRELAEVSYHDLSRSFARLHWTVVLAALALTVINYLVLTGYDQLAFVWIERPIARWRISLASFVGYAVSNNVGLALLSGTSLRYRFYSRWGLSGSEISRVFVFYTGTFFIGITALGGLSLAVVPFPGLSTLSGHAALRLFGAALFCIAPAYALFAIIRRAPVRVGGLMIKTPRPLVVLGQFVVVVLDWLLAVAVLRVLLPSPRLHFSVLLAAFLAAQALALLSHLPGGVGVFESVMVLLLKPFLSVASLLSALVLFRLVYYVVPFVFALAILLVDEINERRAHMTRLSTVFGSLAGEITPRMLAVFTLGAGAVLLFSGATSEMSGKLGHLVRMFPLPMSEASHFLGSVVGVVLLLLSYGIARRIDAAYHLTMGALLLGIVFSLLKGGGLEEVVILVLLLAALWTGRGQFDRRAAFFAAHFSTGWLLAVMAVFGSSLWLGLFVYQHVNYSHQLWWSFALDQHAPRFLRASVGGAMVILAFGVLRLLRPAPTEKPAVTGADLSDAEHVLAEQESTTSYLVYLRDKSLLWNDDRSGFVMYGVQGQTWVALGDPIGPARSISALIRAFIEQVDDFGGRPVFFQVDKRGLHRYADFGLTFIQIGEQALLPLERFTLDGAVGEPFRNLLRRFEAEGGTFRIVESDAVHELLPALWIVSDEWLRTTGAEEKGFSSGFFDDDYVTRFPVAVIERGGNVVAFAVVWPGPQNIELAIDLMRYTDDAPHAVIEALYVHLMRWGKQRGFRRFNFGMLPFSRAEPSSIVAGFFDLGDLVYRKAGSPHHLRRLRAFEEKFQPAWEPRYLAYPGGLSLPRILADVSLLITGKARKA